MKTLNDKRIKFISFNFEPKLYIVMWNHVILIIKTNEDKSINFLKIYVELSHSKLQKGKKIEI